MNNKSALVPVVVMAWCQTGLHVQYPQSDEYNSPLNLQ